MESKKLEIPDDWLPEGHKIYTFLKAHVLLTSWSFCRYACLDYSMKAHVKGLIYEGWIRIRKNSVNDTYILLLCDEECQEQKRINNIKKKHLILTLTVNIDGDFLWERVKRLYHTNGGSCT